MADVAYTPPRIRRPIDLAPINDQSYYPQLGAMEYAPSQWKSHCLMQRETTLSRRNIVQTIKTAVVVVLLLAVCYGAFVALNAPEPELPANIEEWVTGEDEFEKMVGSGMDSSMLSMDSAVPVTADQFLSGIQEPTQPSSTTEPSLPTAPEFPAFQASNSNSPSTQPAVDSAPPAYPSLPPQIGEGENGVSESLAVDPQLSGFPALDMSSMSGEMMGEPPLPDETNAPLGVQPVGSRTNLPAGPGSDQPSMPSVKLPVSPMLDSNLSVEATPETRSGRVLPTMDFATARQQAIGKAEQGQLKEALQMMSPYFDSPELGYAESSDLVDLLDALSKEVIYSPRNLMQPAHTVAQGDTVASVAKAFSINPELLNAINNLGDSKALVPGTPIKVLQGPFHAVVNLTREELTLFLGDDLYAGRFPISVGKDPLPREGVFEVVDRQRDRTYYGSGAKVLPAQDPRNPYGGYWLNLGDDLCIHGTAEMASSDLEEAGCISLAPLDARDVFNILAVGSRVEIHR